MNPTYLYVKTCNHCGKKYFGKTTENNPYKYRGSGVHWKRHLKKHKCSYTTEIIGCYENKLDLVAEALVFSTIYNIVESDEWFNLCVENGLDGAVCGENNPMYGKTHSEEIRKKISELHKGKKLTEKHKKKISESIKGKKNPMFGKDRKGEKNGMYGKKQKRLFCAFCNKNISINCYNRDNHHNGFCLFK